MSTRVITPLEYHHLESWEQQGIASLLQSHDIALTDCLEVRMIGETCEVDVLLRDANGKLYLLGPDGEPLGSQLRAEGETWNPTVAKKTVTFASSR